MNAEQREKAIRLRSLIENSLQIVFPDKIDPQIAMETLFVFFVGFAHFIGLTKEEFQGYTSEIISKFYDNVPKAENR